MAEQERILLVEDSRTQAARTRLLLEDQGWLVTVVSNAEAALEELNHSIPDLIISDYHLPGLDGGDLCRRVRMKINTRGIPIIMLTVDETTESQLRSLESGADDYVSKEVLEDVLILRIQALLQKFHVQDDLLNFANSRFQQARILVIDDSQTFRTFLQQELVAEGLRVDCAADGEEGMQMVEQEAYDCVVVDYVMPGMDGIEVCRELTGLRQTMDSPLVILMLTAHENKEDLTRGLEAGADDFVGKSNDITVVKARIRSLLRRKFFQEQNNRIMGELKARELETIRVRTEKEAAEARAALADKLEQTNDELERTNMELRQAQSQLLHAEKMASLGQLVAGIAHEVNNPLTFSLNYLHTVTGYINHLADSLAGQLSEDQHRRFDKIQKRLADMNTGLIRIRDLVKKLRTFSRLDAGEFGSYNIPESIESTLILLRHRMTGRIEVETAFEASQGLNCFGGELNQVFMNLIANAIDAMEETGTLRISTAEEEDNYIISIKDTGCGMEEAVALRIFDPFYTTKAVDQGTGLGLSISHSIIKAHGGDITVHTRPGEGTEFIIRIPMNLEESHAAQRTGNGESERSIAATASGS